MVIFVLPAGAFITLGFVIATVQKIRDNVTEKKRLEELKETWEKIGPSYGDAAPVENEKEAGV